MYTFESARLFFKYLPIILFCLVQVAHLIKREQQILQVTIQTAG